MSDILIVGGAVGLLALVIWLDFRYSEFSGRKPKR